MHYHYRYIYMLALVVVSAAVVGNVMGVLAMLATLIMGVGMCVFCKHNRL